MKNIDYNYFPFGDSPSSPVEKIEEKIKNIRNKKNKKLILKLR